MEKVRKYFYIFSCAYLFFLMQGILISFFWSEENLRPVVENIFLFPTKEHWLGADSLGRDVFMRIILGARVSLIVGILGSIFSTVLGIVLGIIAGWFGGIVDRVLMRSTDIFLSIPSFAFLAVLSLFFQQVLATWDLVPRSMMVLILSVGLTHWMHTLRVVRGQVIFIKGLSYLEAAQALGGTSFYILRKHVWPALAPTALILFGLQVPTSLLYESFMSFVGLGVQSPMTSWGSLVSEGWKTLSTYPYLILAPSAAIFLTVFSIHGIIDFVQDRAESNPQKWLP